MPRQAVLIPIGQKFERLTVVSGPHRDNATIKYECRCDCGQIGLFRGETLRNGGIRSCGCIRSELLANRNTSHGESGTKLHVVWKGMNARCRDPKHKAYKDYGGKGIAVDPEFSSYESFAKWARENGYEEGLTIERRDNSLNYGPANCTWATHSAQNRNKTNNHRVTFGGKTLCLTEWAEQTGINRYTIFNRLKSGWPIHLALQQQPQGQQCLPL